MSRVAALPSVPALRGGDVHTLLRWLHSGPLVLVWVQHTEGSAPREAGAWMAVSAQGQLGTIGGGQLEWAAAAQAQAHLDVPGWQLQQRHALGPALGQCCGGVVHLGYWRLTAEAGAALQAAWLSQRWPVGLFGGGHVGHAIVQALQPLPCQVHWFDSRDQVFPLGLPAHVQAEHSDPIQRAVEDLPAGTQVLIMSFSHAEDLDIVAACLTRWRRQRDLPFIGLIGSRSKWAAFRHRLLARGHSPSELERVTCPIGVPGIVGKEPAVIAAAVVAQLLQQRPVAQPHDLQGMPPQTPATS
jgi:xanthine dehydrogenase accessory factor